MKYRPELDGLRAIAVLSVLFFHAGVHRFKGGFVGVDIFFVLSGFLITSIIIKELEQGVFSFSSFYERRVRRLVPPAIPVFLFSIAMAVLFLSDEQLGDFANSLLTAVSFSSNWYFLSTVGYFGGPGEMTPLLHTWSLSIEEQFYLLFPAFIFGVYKLWGGRRLFAACFILACVSFAYSTRQVLQNDLEEAFYHSASRFWELLLGAMLACSRFKSPEKIKHCDVLEIGGVLLLLIAIFKYKSSMAFPGPAAIVPAVGTLMIIAAGGRGRWVSPLLKSKPLVAIGLISYGLYLWHWPLLVFAKTVKPLPGPVSIGLVLVVSLLLSVVSYHLLEKPLRSRRKLQTAKSVYGFGVCATACIAGAIAILSSPILAEKRRFASDAAYQLVYGDRASPIRLIEHEHGFYLKELNLNFHGDSGGFSLAKHAGYTCSFDNRNAADKVLGCIVSQAAPSNILVLGDSIGRDTLHALRRAYPDQSFIMLHNSGCPPADSIRLGRKKECFPGFDDLIEDVFARISVAGVIVNFSYTDNWADVGEGLSVLAKHTSNVVLLGVTPKFNVPVGDYLKMLSGDVVPYAIAATAGEEGTVAFDVSVLAQDARKLARSHGADFVDLEPFYCPGRNCRIFSGDSNSRVPLFIDQQHLSSPGISQLAEYLGQQPEIRRLLMKHPGYAANHES